MRLIHRHRNRRQRISRIRFTQEEIAADLHYPAGRRAVDRVTRPIPEGRR
jgi:hypothetical protein